MAMNELTTTSDNHFPWNLAGTLFLLGLTGLLILGAVVVPAVALG